MSEESFRLQVEALRKDTYENWKVSVYDICTLKGVEDHLEEDKPEPQDPEEKKDMEERSNSCEESYGPEPFQ